MAWEERGSCLNIFRTRNRDRIPETFKNYEAKDLLRKAWKGCGSCLNIFRTTNCGRILETFTNYEARPCCAIFAKPSGIDARIGVVMVWEERGSCLNIFRMKNRCRVLETFTNYEARLVAQVSETRRLALYLRCLVELMLELESSWHGRSVDHVLTYSGREIVVGS
ncbi:uncharacterized protein G2W53_026502 [Senna tora]|uniref:Uncharacterized protein n=1 Tax=Senna tora TaxID=362788 RepID=A0A834WFQ7_9FABA|nr:uncharacterized protein G2W53_026502 [Senna tora]